jgi:hypothetical protein
MTESLSPVRRLLRFLYVSRNLSVHMMKTLIGRHYDERFDPSSWI